MSEYIGNLLLNINNYWLSAKNQCIPLLKPGNRARLNKAGNQITPVKQFRLE